MTQYDPFKSPHCAYSDDCVRLLDILLDYPMPLADCAEAFGLGEEDCENLSQLSAHLPTCLFCRSIVARAKVRRDQQRLALKNILEMGGQSVPSTTAGALRAIRAESRSDVKSFRSQHNGHLHITSQPLALGPGNAISLELRPRGIRALRSSTRNILALGAVAALLLVAFGLFKYQLFQQNALGSYQFPSQGWNNMAFFRQNIDPGAHIRTSLINVGSDKGLQHTLIPLDSLIAIEQSQVSPDGKNLLYTGFDAMGALNFYTLFSPIRESPLYRRADGQIVKALWLDNQQIVFVTPDQGIFTINVQTGKQVNIFAHSILEPSSLLFYRQGYLYFVDSQDAGVSGILMRLSLNSGSVEQLSRCSDGRNFRLDDTNQMLAYECMNTASIYEVNIDGSNNHLVHTREGETLVGFAPDGSFLVLESAHGKNALKRFIGSNPKEQTLVDDIAPGALFVHSDNIYVAPDGHAVVVVGDGADGNDKAWFTELDGTANVHELASSNSGQLLIFAGWNKLASLS